MHGCLSLHWKLWWQVSSLSLRTLLLLLASSSPPIWRSAPLRWWLCFLFCCTYQALVAFSKRSFRIGKRRRGPDFTGPLCQLSGASRCAGLFVEIMTMAQKTVHALHLLWLQACKQHDFLNWNVFRCWEVNAQVPCNRSHHTTSQQKQSMFCFTFQLCLLIWRKQSLEWALLKHSCGPEACEKHHLLSSNSSIHQEVNARVCCNLNQVSFWSTHHWKRKETGAILNRLAWHKQHLPMQLLSQFFLARQHCKKVAFWSTKKLLGASLDQKNVTTCKRDLAPQSRTAEFCNCLGSNKLRWLFSYESYFFVSRLFLRAGVLTEHAMLLHCTKTVKNDFSRLFGFSGSTPKPQKLNSFLFFGDPVRK